jgi:hypothetical protein
MTLRYAEVSPNTLRQEYFRAIEKIKSSTPVIEQKLRRFEDSDEPTDGTQFLTDFTLWLRKKTLTAAPHLQKKSFLLQRQIEKIKLKLSSIEQELSQEFEFQIYKGSKR